MTNRSRRGMILLMVLVVISLLSMAALTFMEMMMAEREATDLTVRKVQARLSAESGLEMIRMFLAQTPDLQAQQGGNYDNTMLFQAQKVAPSKNGYSRFTLIAPLIQDGRFQAIRYGIEDESTKVNLNVLASLEQQVPGAGRQVLMALPGMTEDIADAILDWIDQDDEQRDYGAEQEYYSQLDPPYTPTNGPLSTLEELLLVKGVTPGLLFGVDSNRNYVADAGEPSPQSLPDVDNSDGTMDRGWSAYLTLYSLEMNLQPDGVTQRINLNQTDMQQLFDQLQEALGDEAATFIVAYRQNGPKQAAGAGGAGDGGAGGGAGGGGTGGGGGAGGGGAGGGGAGKKTSMWNGFPGDRGLGQDRRVGQGRASDRGPTVEAPGSRWGSARFAGSTHPTTTTGSDYLALNPTSMLFGLLAAQPAGSTSKAGAGSAGSGSTQLDLTKKGNFTINTVLDLIGATVQVQTTVGATQTTSDLPSPFSADPAMMESYLPQLLDYVTTNPSKVIPGRININQAPQVVLNGIPGMTPDIVEQILAQRPTDPSQQDESYKYETWLMTKGIVDLPTMKSLVPFICAQGSIYRCQAVGYFDGPGPAARIEAVIHAGSQPPRVIFWRDISHLGRGYPLEILGVEETTAAP